MSLKDTNDGEIDLNGIIVIGQLVDLLVDHETEDAHHGGTAVIELDIELAGLILGIGDVRAEVSDAVVSVVLGGRHPGELNKGEEGKDLENTSTTV